MSNFRKRNKISSALVHAQSLHKTLNWSFSGRIRAETATKCTQKGDARAKFCLLLFSLLIKPMALFDELVAVASSDLKVPNN